MKNWTYEKKILLAAGIVLICAVLPWVLFRPFNATELLQDVLHTASLADTYGETCNVFVKGSWIDEKNPSQEILDTQSLVNELGVTIVSHIRKKDNRIYRFMKNSSPFGAIGDDTEKSPVIFETLYDNGDEYARHDTSGPWIVFSENTLADMGDYIQQMFQNQSYYSLNDIKGESLRLKEVQSIDEGKKVYIYRGTQTEKSLESARQFFQYPIGTYAVSEQHGDIIVDDKTRSISKTILYTLFEYTDESDPAIHMHIPMYQECEPVPQRDLDVYAPSNSIKTDKEGAREYLLFKVLPK